MTRSRGGCQVEERPAAPLGRRVTAAREAGFILAGWLLYSLVRILVDGRVEAAFTHAYQVMDLERSFGLLIEADLQHAIASNPALVQLFNTIYVWGYWPVLVGTLGWLLVRHRDAYPFYRNALFASGALSLVMFTLYPLAPPRFLPEYGFIDTVSAHAPGYHEMHASTLVNEHAAMPSLHFGWVLLTGIAWVSLGRSPALRTAGVVYPAAMFAAIVLTGNHYVLDGVAGALVVLFGLAVATRLRRAAARRSVPATPVPATPVPVTSISATQVPTNGDAALEAASGPAPDGPAEPASVTKP